MKHQVICVHGRRTYLVELFFKDFERMLTVNVHSVQEISEASSPNLTTVLCAHRDRVYQIELFFKRFEHVLTVNVMSVKDVTSSTHESLHKV